jgi:ABC-2 type transport system permease protein
MKSILLREIKSFFGSPIGYLVIAIFLIINGLFLFVFDGQYNILNSGFADLSSFFTISAWILIFLIPAVTMRSFSDEKKLGTLELLLTKPLSIWQIVGGKFLGSLLLILIAIIPTLIYVYTISCFGNPDFGSILGSYFGLLFLISGYTAIGIFTSTLSENQIVAFIIAVFLCFFFYFGFEGLSHIFKSIEGFIAALGMDNHYKSMSRGVIDTRDVFYFISITFIFLYLTVNRLKNNNISFKTNQKFWIIIAGLLIINLLGSQFFHRFDLTKDSRYTLSDTSLKIIKNINEPLYVDVYLEGDFPGEFKKLQTETQQLLEEFKAYNGNIIFQFVNPLDGENDNMGKAKELAGKGMMPINVSINDNGKQEQSMVFPWAIARYNNKVAKIPLLKNMIGASTADKVVSSVQHLEYAFANAFNTVSKEKQLKIAVIKGNDELPDILMADFIKEARNNYFIGPFTMDSVAKNPIKTVAELKKYDLAIIAKPQKKFTDEEKQVLDQYIVNGGKTLFLIDQVHAEMDSLTETGQTLAFPNDLNLQDLFFKYGIRIDPTIIKDEHAVPIKLATGEAGSQTQYQDYLWKFSPFIYPESSHPIVKNMEGIKFEFASPIELLKNNLTKTILLRSSEMSKTVGTPTEISLSMVEEKTDASDYLNKGNIPVAVLLEGKFKSVYQNRVLPFDDKSFQNESQKVSKMIVISDGDVIKNQLDKDGQPLELGFDKWTNNLYGNKEFMMNCVNYLLDENGLINIRSKEIDIPTLDKEKVYENYTQTQFLNVGLPLLVLGIFGFGFTNLRKRKYGVR